MTPVPESTPNLEDILADESLLDDIVLGYMSVYAGGPLSTLGTKENPITYSNRGIQLDSTIPEIVSQHAKHVLKREQSARRRGAWTKANNSIHPAHIDEYLSTCSMAAYDDGERIEPIPHLDFTADELIVGEEERELAVIMEALERMERRPRYTGVIAQYHPLVQPTIANLATTTTSMSSRAVYEKLQKHHVPVELESKRKSTEVPYIAA
jgi:hypothetical protein